MEKQLIEKKGITIISAEPVSDKMVKKMFKEKLLSECTCECDWCGGTCTLEEGHHDTKEKTLSEDERVAVLLAEHYKKGWDECNEKADEFLKNIW